MLLYLFRHGLAQARTRRSDERRALTAEGAKRTRQAARGLRSLGVAPQTVLTSPLSRAVQTAELACEIFDFPSKRLQTSEVLRPDRPPAQLLELLIGLDSQSVLCVGHAPHLDLVLALAVASNARPIAQLKKAGAACIELRPGEDGRLRWLLEPRALRRLGRGES
jgi:phosphohistidine phosphatase